MSEPIYALVEYEDPYVQPLLLSALQDELPADRLRLIRDVSDLPKPTSLLLQWRQYESIDFERLMSAPVTCLANSYVIRKALIRKHYLSTTVSHWFTKKPDTLLKDHVQPSVEFEVDYAEFLDDALLEAYELKDSWERNASLAEGDSKEWWILKPGMSERGQGIRLFSSEDELVDIFTAWDPPSDDEEDEELSTNGDGNGALDDDPRIDERSREDDNRNIVTSQLRHFIAQPYIDPPLLLPQLHESAGRKFHIRTYVLAVGALKVYVYHEMLALFAAQPYAAPESGDTVNEDLSNHLTNTCLQNGQREGSVHAFWSLPETLADLKHPDWRGKVFKDICSITGELFEAAARSMGIHFQALPNSFEIFGLDFLVDAQGNTWLLEVNAFPDFAQTGTELEGLISKMFRHVVRVGVAPFFGVKPTMSSPEDNAMINVLDIDLGLR
jgi:hypothetical protein